MANEALCGRCGMALKLASHEVRGKAMHGECFLQVLRDEWIRSSGKKREIIEQHANTVKAFLVAFEG